MEAKKQVNGEISSRIHQRLQELNRATRFRPEIEKNLPDVTDEATREAERSLDFQLADRQRDEDLRLRTALVLIERGRYGVCESCEEEINPRRLEVNPTAQYCTDCQSQLEQNS